MRALLAAALLLLPAVAAPPGADPVVHVRVEGAAARVWEGWVALPATYTLQGSYTGQWHTLPGRTPLGALHAAAQAGGFGLVVGDQFDDLVALEVAGEAHWAVAWWDYRVDWVQTNYGAQAQWWAWGEPAHPLQDGARILWYPEVHFTTPMRLRDPLAGCPRPLLVEVPALDPLHNPGQPWPPLAWRPVEAARWAGAAQGPVAAGVGAPLPDAPGWVWAEALPAPVQPPVKLLRSDAAWLACPEKQQSR